jgi:uncharacterized membrane protein
MKKRYLTLLLMILAALPLAAASGVRTNLVTWLEANNLSRELIVVIISMLPVIELRGAIPVGIFLFKFSWFKAAILSIIGNMLPIPFVLLFMDGVFAILRTNKTGLAFTEWLFRRTRKRGRLIEQYKAIGLTMFVGIPLPGTGAWTGSFAANIFGIRFWKSMLFIFIGVLLAAAAVTALCQTGVIVFQ